MAETPKSTLCWKCRNAVPSGDGKYGCSWSLSFIPVEGWYAIPRPRDSFCVISCPNFISDKEDYNGSDKE